MSIDQNSRLAAKPGHNDYFRVEILIKGRCGVWIMSPIFLEAAREQRALEQLLLQAMKAPTMSDTLNALQQARTSIQNSSQREQYHLPEHETAVLAQKVVSSLRDLTHPRRTLDVLVHLKLGQYERDLPEIGRYIDDKQAFKDVCAQAYAHNILKKTLSQLVPIGFEYALLIYERAKEFCHTGLDGEELQTNPQRKEFSPKELLVLCFQGYGRTPEEEQFCDRFFYAALFKTFLETLGKRALRNRHGKISPTTPKECDDLYRWHDELQERVFSIAKKPTLIPLPTGQPITTEEYVPALFLQQLHETLMKEHSPEKAATLAVYCGEFAATVQERLYRRTLEAAKAKDKYFPIWRTAFLRWSQNFRAYLPPSDETPQQEMQDLAQRFFPPLVESTATDQYTNE